MRAELVTSALENIPVDFRADPDGRWEYEELALAAGFDEAWGRVSIGALTDAYSGFPEGAAVVVLTTAAHCAIALVDCLASAAEETQQEEHARVRLVAAEAADAERAAA